MTTLRETLPLSEPQEAVTSRRPLTILAIGYAQSAHVQARVSCFAQMGHKVYLLTETAVEPGIPNVTQLVPGLDPATASSRAFAALSWLCRKVLDINTDHAWRALVFLKFLRQTRPDVVHVHFAYAYYAWMAGILGCRPLVVTVMGGDVLFEEQGAPTREGKWLTLQLLRRADYITSKSHHLTSVLDELGGFGGKTERIVWGIPVSEYRRADASELRAALGVAPDRRVILSPRILQPLYRVHLLVEALPRIVERHPEALLLITEYGADPVYRAQIADRVTELGLGEHVLFCGAVPHERMREYYWAADVAVSVPRSDGMPQTLLEAMACETPNVLNKLSRYQEIVTHGESAYFVDSEPNSIADGVIHLLENPDLCARISKTALQIVQAQGDLGEQARHVEMRYQELVRRRRRRALSPLHFVRTGGSFWNMCAGSR